MNSPATTVESRLSSRLKTGQPRRHLTMKPVLAVVLLLLSLTLPAHPATFYADNSFGDAGFDGTSSIVISNTNHGPKRYVADAISVASNGDQVVVAAGYYQESAWNPGTKSLTLVPQGRVTIVDTNSAQTDTDTDGIPDWWMLKYFGHPTGQTNDHSCASCDPNNNGCNNLCEYNGHTDPLHTCPTVLPPYTANYQTNIVCNTIIFPNDVVVGSNTFADVLLIQNRGVLSNGLGVVGYETNSVNNSVLVTGPGSVWSNASDLYLGGYGAGNSLVISNGAQVVSGYDPDHNHYLGDSIVGSSASSINNTVLVTGPGSVWSNALAVYLGVDGAGNSLVISNGGQVVSGCDPGSDYYLGDSYVGFSASSINNRVLVTGPGSVWSNVSAFFVGGDGAGNSLVISNGGQVIVDGLYGNGISCVGSSASSSNNSVLVTGPGSIWSSRCILYVGDDGSGNSLVISNGGQVVSGYDDSGLGGRTVVGNGVGSNNSVLVTGPGSVWSNAFDLQVGQSGAGNSFVINDGGQVVSGRGGVGADGGTNTVLVTGTGSVWSNSGIFIVGDTGTGNSLLVNNGGRLVSDGALYFGNNGSGGGSNSMVISSGGCVVNGDSRVGNTEQGNDSVLVTDAGSVWENRGLLNLGCSSGPNSVVISNGGKMVTTSALMGGDYGDPSNTVLVTGSGSVWSNQSSLLVGYYASWSGHATGPGILIVSDDGAVVSTSINVGYTQGPPTNLVMVNGGQLILDGLLQVDAGTLTVNSGTCTVGALVLDDGGYSTALFNGGIVTVTGNATISNGARVQFALGTNSHPVAVAGDLTWGGSLRLIDGGGFTNGIYTLFTYGGTFTYEGVTGNTAPNTNFSYMIDATTAGQVTMVVSDPGAPGISILLMESNTYSGVIDIRTAVSMMGGQELTGVYFLLDGEPSMSIGQPDATGNPFSGVWNTVGVPNGWHTIQAFATYWTGDFDDSSGGYESYASQVLDVQVINPISLDIPYAYGDEDTGASFSFPISATLSTATAQWTVVVSSCSNTTLKSYSGTTTNGLIYAEWDGTDLSGSTYTGPLINVLVGTVVSNQPSGLGAFSMTVVSNFAGQAVYMTAPTYGRQNWSLAYENNSWFGPCNDVQKGGAFFCNMFYDAAQAYSHGGLYDILHVYPGSYDIANSNNNGYDNVVALIASADDWTAFWQNFKGNNAPTSFFLFSHGSPTKLGDDTTGIDIAKVESILGNYVSNGVWVVNTPFRFAQFDACNTSGWEKALGIPSFKTNSAYFSSVRLNPRACLTWHTKKVVGIDRNFHAQHGILITGFNYDWISGSDYPTLQQACDHNFGSLSQGSRPDIHGAADMLAP